MYICANCRRFINEELIECHNCNALVCTQCILIIENEEDMEMARRCGWPKCSQYCTNCQCAGNCIREQPYKLRIGEKCNRCKLQYCDECSDTICGDSYEMHNINK